MPSLVLAGLHLRLGSLALARAELETLAAEGGLDRDGRVDLAEVRWRTGDLLGAGEAARESLAAGDESVIALVVAAEAAAALGRPTESRRLATQAQARMGGPIDPIFAGHAPLRGLAGRPGRARAVADDAVPARTACRRQRPRGRASRRCRPRRGR